MRVIGLTYTFFPFSRSLAKNFSSTFFTSFLKRCRKRPVKGLKCSRVITYAELHGNMQMCRIKSLHGNKLEFTLDELNKPFDAIRTMIGDATKPLRDLNISDGFKLPTTDYTLGVGELRPAGEQSPDVNRVNSEKPLT